MSMDITLKLMAPVRLWGLEEAAQAFAEAERKQGCVYSWRTVSVHNWLEKGCHVADVLGLVVLPAGLPDVIEMPDDEET